MRALTFFVRRRAMACGGALAMLLSFPTHGFTQSAIVVAADTVRAESTPNNPTPLPNEIITVAINVDVSNLQAPNNKLGSYQAMLTWDPTVLQFLTTVPAPSPWNAPNLNLNEVTQGKLQWNDFQTGGSAGKINILDINFKVIGVPGSSTVLDLSFSDLVTTTFIRILDQLQIKDGKVTVRSANRAPILAAISNQTMNEGDTLEVGVSATDPDGNKITLAATNLPSFAGFTDNRDGTGRIRFTPNFFAAGVYSNIQMTATDDGTPASSASVSFTLTVLNVNRAPLLVSLADQAMNEGATLEVPVSATDPDGNKIKFAASNLPSFGSLTDNGDGTGKIRFTPGFFAAGVYSHIQVIATDDGVPARDDTVSFTLTVLNINRAPHIRPPGSITLSEGDVFDVKLSAEDPDSDKIALRVINLPVFASFVDSGDGTGTVHLAPGGDDAGSYPKITLVATDNGNPNLSDSTQLDLTVVDRPTSLVCKTEIVSPPDGAIIRADSVEVCVTTQVSGAVGKVEKVCNVNGFPLVASCVKVPIKVGLNTIIATCTVTDSLSSCVSADTIRVERRPDTLSCSLTLTPAAGAIVCGDSVEVVGTITITGGFPPYAKTCNVNGVPATNTATGFILKLPCVPGNNIIIATCKVTDTENSVTICRDTINVIHPAPPVCKLEITAPADSALTCDKAVKVSATTSITGGIPPYITTSDINGVAAVVTGNTITTTVSLAPGWNNLIARFTVTDSCGKTVVCRDTIRVQSNTDNLAPTCTFTPGYKSVTGTFFDNESGIATIEALFLFNAKLTVDPFTPGAKKVNFRLDDLGLEPYLGFDIKITDQCGNTHICDPVLSYLSADDQARSYTFKFRSVDRYLILENHGLSGIQVDLNGHQFSLAAEPNRNVRALNTYHIPQEGSITIDLKPYLQEGENVMRLEIGGRAGTGADFTLIDEAHAIDHTLELQPIPTAFQLSQNYPNPFNPSTTIHFGIPAQVAEGAVVQLRIYNALGEVVRTLVDKKLPPGQYAVEWNGRNARGETVATGIYIYQLLTSGFKETKRMIFLK